MAVGDNALKGIKETITSHTFPATEKDERIWFKGYQIRISKEGYSAQSDPEEQLEINVSQGRTFEVPSGYECHVDHCEAYFLK